MKKFIIIVLLLFSVAILFYWRSRDFLLQWKYDLSHSNPYVSNKDSIQNILNAYPNFQYNDLSLDYLQVTGQDVEPFKGMLQHSVYLQIPQQDIYKKVVGNFRLKHFIPKDSFYKKALFNQDSLLVILDVKMLFQVLKFQDLLEAGGYDRDAFIITNGYRHPHFNELVGGASQSRHIVGEAVDITARDINGDGIADQQDKSIIVEIAEEVVGNSGGVGLYPNTLSIHMDTRGYKARWNTF